MEEGPVFRLGVTLSGLAEEDKTKSTYVSDAELTQLAAYAEHIRVDSLDHQKRELFRKARLAQSLSAYARFEAAMRSGISGADYAEYARQKAEEAKVEAEAKNAATDVATVTVGDSAVLDVVPAEKLTA